VKIAVVLAVVAAVAVMNIALFAALGPDSHAALWVGKIFNFAVLIAAFVWGVPKMMGKSYGEYFAGEREAVRQSLADADARRREAEEKLKALEEKLRAMDAEAARVAEKAREDAREDALRLREQAAEEERRISGKTEREIALRVEAAKRDLRRYAAESIAALAVEEAGKRVDDAARERLFARAVKALEEKIQ
jgi:F-type H+-transporting ATPase subunit b